MKAAEKVTGQTILDSLSDGIYVCDNNRQITYWSESAVRITGWKQADVIGKHCFDNILCHIDKDGHELCGKEFCPLHRAIVTGQLSRVSQLVYAQGATGQRIPMEVTVAPIHDDAGNVIGGVETFRDASAVVRDLERAKTIQQSAMEEDVPEGAELTFTPHYISHDIVGGDYYAIKALGDGRYGLILADVMGHGIAAALYTMHLSSLWNRHHPLLKKPVAFLEAINDELVTVIKQEGSFATAVCGLIDLNEHVFQFAGAGGPEAVLMHEDGTYECLKSDGLPLGIMSQYDYEQLTCAFDPGDSLLLFSDGAIEIENADGKMLGPEGLIDIIKSQGYPQVPIRMVALEEALLQYSNAIRLEDDLTIIEIRLKGTS
ncbi:MAG: PP2C family protein-serine/threonine phosphatase [Planctomycetota bacterium]|jgi:PAS domain S-box-containing protein